MNANVGPGGERRSIDEILETARARLNRFGPEQLDAERAAVALIVDIRPIEQRQRDGECPGAVAIDRNVLEWRLDPIADYALVLMLPAKAVMPRARWLDVLPDYVVHDYAVEDEAADVDDDLAVVLHRDRMHATVLGEDRSGTFIITDVWRNGNDGWRVWRRHSTPLAAGRLPGVP